MLFELKLISQKYLFNLVYDLLFSTRKISGHCILLTLDLAVKLRKYVKELQAYLAKILHVSVCMPAVLILIILFITIEVVT